MINPSVIKAKINRSGVSFTRTVVVNEERIKESTDLYKLFLLNDEEVILYFKKSLEYRWILTTYRLFFPLENKQILYNEIGQVDFEHSVSGENSKSTNTEIKLDLKDGSSKLIFVEENTWHLFYEIFDFVIRKMN